MAIKKISANLLGNNAVTAASIAGGAISAADIADNSITAAKLSTSTFAIDSLTVNTSDLVVDTANNRVGIGASSPSHNLHVKDISGHATARIEGLSNSYKGTLLVSSAGSGDGGIQYDASNNQFHQFSYGDMIFYSGTGNISGSYPTNERMRIDSVTGNIGINESNPTSSLHIERSTNASDRALYAANATTSTSVDYNKYGITGLAYGASGSWSRGIGVTGVVDATRFHKAIGVAGTLSTSEPTGYGFDAAIYGDGASVGYSGIFLNGDFGIGTSSVTSKLHVDAGTYAGYAVDLVQGGSGGGNHGLRVVSGSGSSYSLIVRANASTVFYVDGAGNYYFSGSNQSDLNKKENIADLTDNALDLITQLQPKTYNFIGNDIDKAGFIAQEMEQVIPRLVSGNEFDPDATDEDGNNPTGKGIDYMGYTAYLTKAIQEQQTIIDALKARLDSAGL